MPIRSLLPGFLVLAVLLLAVTAAADAQPPSSQSVPLSSPLNPEDPDPDEFIVDATLPELEEGQLQKHIAYPEEAKRNGIEGRVYVQVLVDENGRATGYRIVQSDHPIFNGAAIAAVMNATYTPGLVENKPARMWITVPIKFALE